MRAALIPEDGEPIELGGDVTLIGRRSDICDLVLDETSISKIHCLLVKTEGLLYVRDLGSTNGTSVNGQRITRGALLPGDRLSFAKTIYKVHLGPDDLSIPGFTREQAVKAHESSHGPIAANEPDRSADALKVDLDLSGLADADEGEGSRLMDLDVDDPGASAPETRNEKKPQRKPPKDPFLTSQEVEASYQDLVPPDSDELPALPID